MTVAVDGPDPDDGLGFNVFPNHRDALGDLNHPTFAGQKVHIVPGGVPGYANLPGHMWTGSITGKNAFGKTITIGISARSEAEQRGFVNRRAFGWGPGAAP